MQLTIEFFLLTIKAAALALVQYLMAVSNLPSAINTKENTVTSPPVSEAGGSSFNVESDQNHPVITPVVRHRRIRTKAASVIPGTDPQEMQRFTEMGFSRRNIEMAFRALSKKFFYCFIVCLLYKCCFCLLINYHLNINLYIVVTA